MVLFSGTPLPMVCPGCRCRLEMHVGLALASTTLEPWPEAQEPQDLELGPHAQEPQGNPDQWQAAWFSSWHGYVSDEWWQEMDTTSQDARWSLNEWDDGEVWVTPTRLPPRVPPH